MAERGESSPGREPEGEEPPDRWRSGEIFLPSPSFSPPALPPPWPDQAREGECHFLRRPRKKNCCLSVGEETPGGSGGRLPEIILQFYLLFNLIFLISHDFLFPPPPALQPFKRIPPEPRGGGRGE